MTSAVGVDGLFASAAVMGTTPSLADHQCDWQGLRTGLRHCHLNQPSQANGTATIDQLVLKLHARAATIQCLSGAACRQLRGAR